MTKARDKTQKRREQIMAALSDGGMTIPALARKIRCSDTTIANDIRALKGERLVYIADYAGADNHFAPIYAPGCNEDAPAPEGKAACDEKRRATWAKRTASVVRREHAFRHWLDIAFFGEYRREA